MQTYNREYLQSLPEKKKQQEFDWMVQGFWQALYQAAESGKTSYFFDMTYVRMISPSDLTHRNQPLARGHYVTTMTNEEIITHFQQKFPDCSIKYDEEWLESSSNTKVLKKGVTIDWS